MTNRPIVHLVRDIVMAGPLGTFGDLMFGGFKCKTLERPPTGDYPCIPANELSYDVEWTTHHPHHPGCYEVMRVPGRTDILIHSANVFEQLRGCIALGKKQEVVSVTWDSVAISHAGITQSRATIDEFVAVMQMRPFNLIIKEA